MTIRVKHKVVVQNSLDTSAKRKLFYQEDDNTAEVVSDAFERQTGGVLDIDVSSTEALPFGDVTDVRGVYIEVDGACDVRVNGSPDPIPIQPAPAATQAKLLLEAGITGITIENSSATNRLTGHYCLWGDPTA